MLVGGEDTQESRPGACIHMDTDSQPASATRTNSALRTLPNELRQHINERSLGEEPDGSDDNCTTTTTLPYQSDECLEREMPPKALLRLNVGGESFVLSEQTLTRSFARGLLHEFVTMQHTERLTVCDGYLAGSQEYYFERLPCVFAQIYRYYLTGSLQKPVDVSEDEFSVELDFWQLTVRPNIIEEVRQTPAKVLLTDFSDARCGRIRHRVWNLMEEPQSSTAALVFSMTSILFVIISVLALILSSIPEFQVEQSRPSPIGNISTSEGVTTTPKPHRDPHPAFDYVEAVCMAWFTGEYALKLLVATRRCAFCLRLISLIDLVAIVPYYLELTLSLAGQGSKELHNVKAVFLVVRILRLARVVRVFKLGRHSEGLQMFARTLARSLRQLGMMCVVLATAIIFFATTIYFVEKDDPDTHFTSIPAGFWWCLVTMTTVGYGDMVPITLGRRKHKE